MKAVRIVSILSLFAAVSAAYVWLRSTPETAPVAEPIAIPIEQQMVMPATNEAPVDAKEPVQPLEERGDAMLFEVEALGNTPFDESITMPFE